MTDLQNPNDQIDPKFNIYFQNKRIRRHLIKAGLINRQGEILPAINSEVALNRRPTRQRRPLSADKLSKSIHHYVLEDEQKRRKHTRNQFDFSAKRVHIEKKPESKHTTRRDRSHSSLNVHHSIALGTKNRSPTRPKSAHHSLHDSKKCLARYSVKPTSRNRERRRVIMIYYGPTTNIDYNTTWFQPDGDEIVVSQQHCGGENLVVFKGYVKPYEKFEFESRRHRDYPFALTLYINGLIDSRLSACCEHRHKRNVPLGGKHGLFGIVDVKNIKPCRCCRYKQRKTKSRSTISLGIEPSRYRRSVVPRFQLRSRSKSPEIRQTSSSPHVIIKSRDHSPHISKTPTPPPIADNKKPRIYSAKPNRSEVSANTQKVAISLNNDNENYSSDFDETNDDDAPPSTSRFGQPRISDSNSIGSNSPIISKKPTSSKDENNYDLSKIPMKKNDTEIHSRKSSSTISKKSNLSENEDNHYKSTMLPKKPNNINHLSSTSTHTSKKSDSSKDKDNDILIGKNNTTDHVEKSLSNTSKKSDFFDDNDSDHYKSTTLTKKTNDDDDNSSNSLHGFFKKSDPSKDEYNYDLSNEKNINTNYSRKTSSSSSTKSDLLDNDNYKSTQKNDDIDNFQNSSSNILKKSRPSKDETNYELLDMLMKTKDTTDHSQNSSSDTSKISDLSENEDNHYKSTTLTKKNNDNDKLSTSSDSTIKKFRNYQNEDNDKQSNSSIERNNDENHSPNSSSELDEEDEEEEEEENDYYKSETPIKTHDNDNNSPRYEFNKKNTNDNKLSLTTTFKNNIENRRLSSSSEDKNFKALFAKKPQNIDYTTNLPRVSISSTEDIFGTKQYSSTKKNKDVPVFSKDWFETNNKINLDDNDETSFNSNSKTKPRRKDLSSDEDGTYYDSYYLVQNLY
ncbi:unnamed protein product [Rotaria sp. Silwood1]|nr:unnamed protein product [Rotaria sp. Silwood1]CAF4699849.1 unnamed protein product [Rotaria sp. Silwood1]